MLPTETPQGRQSPAGLRADPRRSPPHSFPAQGLVVPASRQGQPRRRLDNSPDTMLAVNITPELSRTRPRISACASGVRVGRKAKVFRDSRDMFEPGGEASKPPRHFFGRQNAVRP
jgi:hypothetical protein